MLNMMTYVLNNMNHPLQAPKIVTGLQTTIMKRAGDTGFIVTCSAAGKPKPKVAWFKDGVEISAGGDSEIYQISTSEQVNSHTRNTKTQNEFKSRFC